MHGGGTRGRQGLFLADKISNVDGHLKFLVWFLFLSRHFWRLRVGIGADFCYHFRALEWGSRSWSVRSFSTRVCATIYWTECMICVIFWGKSYLRLWCFGGVLMLQKRSSTRSGWLIWEKSGIGDINTVYKIGDQ